MGKEVARIITKILEALLFVCGAGMIVLVVVQVFSRFVVQLSIQGMEELARLVFVWGCFIGVGYSALKNDHIRVDFLLSKIPEKQRRLVHVVLFLIMLGVGVIMVVEGTKFVVDKWMFPDYNTALLFPRSLFWLPVPITGFIVVVQTCIRIGITIKSIAAKPR